MRRNGLRTWLYCIAVSVIVQMNLFSCYIIISTWKRNPLVFNLLCLAIFGTFAVLFTASIVYEIRFEIRRRRRIYGDLGKENQHERN